MADSRIQRRLAAILAADVVGYSRLTESDEEGTLRALGETRAVLDELVAAHNGRVFNTGGDSVLAEFASAVDAVRCAVAWQERLARRNAAPDAGPALTFRIGIHVGDVVVEGADLLGDGVNVAARLEGLAEPGGISLSEDAYRQVRGKLDIAVADAGPQRLKNISHPVRMYRIAGAAPAVGRAFASRRRLVAAAAVLAVLAAAGGLWLADGWQAIQGRDADKAASRRPAAERDLPIVAVLPFADHTGDGEKAYLADGITEEVINALGRFNTLRVIGSNAVRLYKSRPATKAEIRAELGASYVVEGGVWRAAERLRISVQMSDVASGTVLWSDRYDGKMTGIFEVQDTIARGIAGRLAANIGQIEGRQALRRALPSPDAYDLVLRARAEGFTASRKANRQFRELMRRAVERDPDYATAHALLAEAMFAQVVLGWAAFPDRVLKDSEAHARRSIALAPDEPDGHRALGRLLVLRTEYDRGREELRRAIEINPSDAYALGTWGSVQAFAGEIAPGIEALERALRYDPTLEAYYFFDLSVAYYLARRNEDSIRAAERGMSRFPEFAMLNVPAAAAAARLGRASETARYAEAIRRRIPLIDLETIGTRYKDPAYRAYIREGLRLAGL